MSSLKANYNNDEDSTPFIIDQDEERHEQAGEKNCQERCDKDRIRGRRGRRFVIAAPQEEYLCRTPFCIKEPYAETSPPSPPRPKTVKSSTFPDITIDGEHTICKQYLQLPVFDNVDERISEAFPDITIDGEHTICKQYLQLPVFDNVDERISEARHPVHLLSVRRRLVSHSC